MQRSLDSRAPAALARPRVLLADDHRILLDALIGMLEPGVDIVGTASDGHELVDRAHELDPDVVVIDVGMPRLDGLAAGRRIARTTPRARLVYLTADEDEAVAEEAMRSGASGFVLKRCAGEELLQAIETALAGGTYRSAADKTEPDPFDESAGDGSIQLSVRQREVLRLLAAGDSMKEVAASLGIATRTVAYHKYRLMEQLGLRTNAELIQLAIRLGLGSS